MENGSAAPDRRPFADLGEHKYCQLVSFRRDGAAVPTPVWFAVEGGRLYVKTDTPSGKVRRIRNDPRVQVAPCTLRGRRLGPLSEGRGRIVAAHEEAVAEAALRRRYRLGRRLFTLFVEPLLLMRGSSPVYLEIVPAAEAAAP
jgi:uncharacterized protein